jgi:hypothetical protein
MKKPSRSTRLLASDLGPHNSVLNWRNVPKRDLWLYARSFHTAAKKLAGALELDSGTFTDFNACPVVFMYRHAIELHLKALVLGEGGNFLETKPDTLSVHKTHSVPWLAQFVCQIITALKWEMEFRCDGIENLVDFKAVIEELSTVDPGSYVFRLPVRAEGQNSASGRVNLTIREFGRKMDALLELLDSTADALAAEWDMRSEAAALDTELGCGNDFDPTIQ